MNLFQKVFGTRSEHEVKRIMPLVEKTESLRPEMIRGVRASSIRTESISSMIQ